MEIRKLKKVNYDELINLFNTVFSRKNKRNMNFENELPKMCVKDDEHMGKHIGVFEGDKMCAALGIYPLPTMIGDENLLFSTVGNVATLPEFEGRGYMNKMMIAAMEELTCINADASRLGGNRQRYNRFGYENAGTLYKFSFTEYNRVKCFPDFKDDIEFVKIKKDDHEALQYTLDLHNKGKIHVIRSSDFGYRDVFASLTAWRNTAYVINKAGKRIGYLSVSPTLETIAEIHTDTPEHLPDAVCAWQKECGENVTISFAPYEYKEMQPFYRICPEMTIAMPSHFKICNWEKVIGALMKIKASYTELYDGEFILGIKDYGSIMMRSKGNVTECERTSAPADFEVDHLTATRLLLSPYPCICDGNGSALLSSWCPLPLSWNLQDRV